MVWRLGPGDAGEFWRRLLLQRGEATWGNFAWFSPKTLLLSLNDQVVKNIEEPGASGGSIVDRRRMRWREAQRAAGVDDALSLTVGDRGVLLLGDPGEMDVSQYVLVRDLSAQRQTFRDRGINTALLMSDVVYPAGNINHWRDAVYLPYLGLPRKAWNSAVRAWREHRPGAPLEPPLLGWNVLAMPGNHDWYDGLNGFMYHACGSEPLPEVSYDDSDFTWRQRLARRWWRNPAPPRRESIQILRAELTGSRPAEPEQPSEPAVGHGIPSLPGPYYQVNFAPDGEVLFRLIVIDTGITGTVDREQADWLQTTALVDDVPKILVTGIPLAVDNTVSRLRVPPAASLNDASGAAKPEESTHLATLIRPEHRVVASIAGDTHNYQRMTFGTAPDGGWPIPVNIVSGGAGAYLSQAHSVTLTESGGLEVSVEEFSPGALDIELPARRHTRFPSREGSVLHFARQRRDYAVLILILAAAAAGALLWWVTAVERFLTDAQLDEELGHVSRPLVVLAPFGVCIVVGLLLWLQVWLRRRRAQRATTPGGRASSGRRLIRLGALLGAAGVILWWLTGDAVASGAPAGGAARLVSIERWAGIVLCSTAFCLLLIAFQAIPPLVQSFPGLRSSWISRGVLLGLLVLYFSNYPQSVALTLVAVVFAVWYFLHFEVGYRAVMRALTQRRLSQPRDLSTWFVRGVLRWLPFLSTVGLILLLTVLEPEKTVHLLGGSGASAAFLGAAARCLALGNCVLLLMAAAGALVVPPVKGSRAWRTMPRSARVAVVPVVGGVGWWAWVELAQRLPWLVVVVAVGFAGAIAALLAVGLTVAAAWYRRARPDDVRAALRARDGVGQVEPSLALFAAMMVAGVPKIDAMAEVPDAPFAKNVLLLTHEDGPDGPVLTFEAWGLNDESREDTPPAPTWPTRSAEKDHGFFIIDRLSWPVSR